MANLALTPVPVDGGLADLAAVAVAAAGGGDSAPCGPGRALVVINGGGASVTVTVASPGTVSGLDVENPAVVVSAGDTGILPLPRLLAGANGRAAITYSGVTSVSVAVVEVG